MDNLKKLMQNLLATTKVANKKINEEDYFYALIILNKIVLDTKDVIDEVHDKKLKVKN